MSSLIQRLVKRRAYPVVIGDETVHVRPLTLGESVVLDSLDGEKRIGWAIGCALVDDSGQSAFPQSANESNADFAARVSEALKDVPQDTLSAISHGVEKASRVPPVETLKKS